MITIQEIQRKTSELVAAEPSQRQTILTELACISPELVPSTPLFSVPLRDGTILYMRQLDYPMAVRLTFGVPYNQSLPALFRQYSGTGWPNPELDIFRTTVVAVDKKHYNVCSQFEFSVVITNQDATQAVAFHLVNAEKEGLYGRMIVVDEHFRGQNLAFLMLAFQAEYATRYGVAGDLEHKKPIHLLKHKGHNTTISTQRLLQKIGYSAFRQDPNDKDYWQVAEHPATILKRVKELGYREKGVYF